MACGSAEYHHEHYYLDEEGGDAWCRGNYEVVETFGPWRIVLDPGNPAQGFIDTDPESDLPPYAIDSTRVHEGEPDGHTWRDQIGEKIWAQDYLREFAAALVAAQQRWPKR